MKAFLTRETYDTPLLAEKLSVAGIDLEVRTDSSVCPREVLEQQVSRVDALLTHTEDEIDADLLSRAAPQLRVVANMGIGFSNIDVAAARARGVIVTNTPTEEAFEATAEATVAILLSVARRIPALHVERRALTCDPDPSFLRATATSVRGKTLGIVGMGRIGSRVARIMHGGFGNRIQYFDLVAKPELEEALGARRVDLPTLMRSSDLIAVNMPLSQQTRNLISAEMIDLMQDHATFVNTARGELVDEPALVARLNAGKLHGAGLDVYGPAVDDIQFDNIALTSHFANFEDQAYTAMTTLVADNVVSALTTGQALTPVKE
ncbi:D-glycerate dehydrogenase [Parahaliea maris]|uniref:D-glycerate dehydrogenase n=1 Tax=Parahaliea maris TaxID=2716870 RepID=A0A5C8ZS83_9GAMM|nr:NAD(P)-dependent oxidoreductase [Parahaliea maris]TXS91245.1 D-glycerate dehydrogenase [Parahaliea maris]